MSTPKSDGGPAFPAIKQGPAGTVVVMSEGMTLRDWFAGQALAGLCAAHANPSAIGYPDNKETVEKAWALADAMLAEREAKK